jgi:hypothetical protein
LPVVNGYHKYIVTILIEKKNIFRKKALDHGFDNHL